METVRNVYFHRTSDDLRTLRSKKVVELRRWEGDHHTYFTQQRARQLRSQIAAIDVVLASRADQLGWF